MSGKRARTTLLVMMSSVLILILSIQAAAPATTVYADDGKPPASNPYFKVEPVTAAGGKHFSKMTISGPPQPPPGYEAERAAIVPYSVATEHSLNVPAYTWVYGCSAVSAAMVAGYYDNYGYGNMYAGPTNGGIMPYTDSSWPTWSDSEPHTYPNNPLIASHNGVDGRATKGSIDDYWVKYGSTANDPYITGSWTQHTWGTAVGDYMKTSQSSHGNTDGSTSFYADLSSPDKLQCSDMVGYGFAQDDGTYGRKLFYEARGYTVTDCFSQATDNQVSGGFSLADYKAQIDAGHPVFLNLAGHSIVGVGYDTASNTIYIHDTWDTDEHSMTWGGSYSSMELQTVSIVNLSAVTPTPLTPSGMTLDTTPTYTWTQVPGATQYQYETVSGGTSVYTKLVDASACAGGTCTDTPTDVLTADSDYVWHVQASVAGAWGAYSADKSFTVISVPVAPTPLTPSGTTMTDTPAYTWTVLDGADLYQYEIANTGGVLYTSPELAASCAAGTCSDTPVFPLTAGDYVWHVKAHGNGAWSGYSADLAFTVNLTPPAPTPKTPTGTITDTTPTFTWSPVAGATSYKFQLVKGATGVYTKTVAPTACTATVCTNTPTTVLSYAAYKWHVMVEVGSLWSSYSADMAFTVTNVPIPKTPSGTISTKTPTFTWTRIPGATQYQLNVYKGTALTYSRTVAASTCGSNASICSNKPTNSLADAGYKWNIRSSVGGKWGAYSAYKTFTVNTKPKSGYWEAASADFYVTSARTYVDDFTMYFSVPACGIYGYITHTPLVHISNSRFSFTGAYFANGTFSSMTRATGRTGLNHFYIPGCGYVSGSFSWTATWRYAAREPSMSISQPTDFLRQLTVPGVRPLNAYAIMDLVGH